MGIYRERAVSPVIIRSEQNEILGDAAKEQYLARILNFLDSTSPSGPRSYQPDEVSSVREDIEAARSLGLGSERQVAAYVYGRQNAIFSPPGPLLKGWDHASSTDDILSSFSDLEGTRPVAEKIDREFTDQNAGAACVRCRLKNNQIEVLLVPWPPRHLPKNQATGQGENEFTPDYRYILTAPNGSSMSGVLGFTNETRIFMKDLPVGVCTLSLRAPSFKEDVQTRWRREWRSLATNVDATYAGLVTDRIHRFLIINELWVASLFTARMLERCIGDSRLLQIRGLLRDAEGLAGYGGGGALGKVWKVREADAIFKELFDYGKVWDLKVPFAERTVKGLETFDPGVGDLGVSEIPDHVLGHWHSWGPWEYYYDVWANIFFGFAGREAGYSLERLHEAASQAQWLQGAKETLKSVWDLEPKVGTFSETDQDREAISLGYRLHEEGQSVTPERLIKEVTSQPAFDRRPHSYNSFVGSRTIRKTSTTTFQKKTAKRSSVSSQTQVRRYQAEILAASKKYGVPPELIAATMQKESGGNPNALSFDGQHGKGLMQIDDRFHKFARGPDAMVPAANIDYGASLIRDNMRAFPGNLDAAIAAYNAGQGSVRRALKRGTPLSKVTYDPSYVEDIKGAMGSYGDMHE